MPASPLAGWPGAAALAGITALAAVLCILAWHGAAEGTKP
ncbi:hypothetical protein Clow_01628 [Corynebacterium lowii]|uniref:Uncharacterized protein n=1 Tax=Corynebacterium lowii TaxID=1544413 RepID=A0A0Q0UDB2_9CORY|nr:hypothetical protein Clow_01628 [Corynebacterium lowii]MDP9850685.1 hypothetical protein [Corynebacterium lowii]